VLLVDSLLFVCLFVCFLWTPLSCFLYIKKKMHRFIRRVKERIFWKIPVRLCTLNAETKQSFQTKCFVIVIADFHII
jgi:hypothetical protein